MDDFRKRLIHLRSKQIWDEKIFGEKGELEKEKLVNFNYLKNKRRIDNDSQQEGI